MAENTSEETPKTEGTEETPKTEQGYVLKHNFKKDKKVEQSGLGVSFKSTNPNEFPIVYADDAWDIAEKGSKLAVLMNNGGEGKEETYTQHDINHKLAEIKGGGGGNIDEGLLAWIIEHRRETIIKVINELFTIEDPSGNEYLNPAEETEHTMLVKVSLFWRGNAINAAEIPSGWEQVKDAKGNLVTGVYSKSVTAHYPAKTSPEKDAVIDAASWSITIPSDDEYAEFNINPDPKQSKQHKIMISYPAWHGWSIIRGVDGSGHPTLAASEVATRLENVIKEGGLAMTTSYSATEVTSDKAPQSYYWIIVPKGIVPKLQKKDGTTYLANDGKKSIPILSDIKMNNAKLLSKVAVNNDNYSLDKTYDVYTSTNSVSPQSPTWSSIEVSINGDKTITAKQ
ncbi:MAG: hypothetical protein IKR17_02695 [Bacteroidales bacterium]|nr:hypothetical protein [Bacteroidales bacterium]